MDLVDGLRDEQKKKRKKKNKLTKKYCNKCKKCVPARNCNGADFSKCEKVRSKCWKKFKVLVPKEG